MTPWIIWSVATSALVAAAAAALEHLASSVGVSRRAIWIGAIGAVIVSPLVFGLRRAPLELHPGSAATVERRIAEESHTRPANAGVVSVAQSRAMRSAPPADSDGSRYTAGRFDWRETLAAWSSRVERADEWVARAWLVASSILMILLAIAVARLRSRSARWTTIDTEIGRVLVSPNVGPAVVGFLRPRVVLPRWALSIEGRMRALLLRHELEHLRAGDTRTLLVSELALIAFPWNAPLWWMVRRLRLAVEVDCDARVIRAVGGGGAYEYGAMLLAVGAQHVVRAPLGASLSEPRSSLEARIEAMTARRRPLASGLAWLAVAVLALATAAWTPRPSPLLHPRAIAVASAAVTINAAGPRRTSVAEARHDSATVSTRDPEAPVESRSASVGIATDPKPLPGNPAPVYPDPLRRQNIEGFVTVELRTNARGIPDTTTIQIFESTNELFTAAVRKVLPAWRFDSGGSVALAFRFMTTATGAAEAASGASPVFSVGGKLVVPAVITTIASSDAEFPIGVLRAWTAMHHPSVMQGDTTINTIAFVVDSNQHYVRSAATNIPGAARASWREILDSLAPQEIQHVEILKGRLAAATYGSAAANGVIVITTTRGVKAADLDSTVVDSLRARLRRFTDNQPLLVIDGLIVSPREPIAICSPCDLVGSAAKPLQDLGIDDGHVQWMESLQLAGGRIGPNPLHVIVVQLKRSF